MIVTAFVSTQAITSFRHPIFPRSVSLRTAIRWLHHLGFKSKNHKKGVYINGHEREDVVKHREEFLKTMDQLRLSHKPPPQRAQGQN